METVKQEGIDIMVMDVSKKYACRRCHLIVWIKQTNRIQIINQLGNDRIELLYTGSAFPVLLQVIMVCS
jgi:hypothetical protein